MASHRALRPVPAALLALLLAATLAPLAPPAGGNSDDAASPQRIGPGTFTLLLADDPGCPPDHTCLVFRVACGDLQQDEMGTFAIGPARGAGKGLVVFASGGPGTSWWAPQDPALAFLHDLRDEGLAGAQLRWHDGWLQAAPGEDAGPGRLSCRPATAVAWLHETLYPALAPLGAGQNVLAPGRCGFCMTGNSAGASQTAYLLSFHGLEDLLDAAVATNGPPHGDETKGCLRRVGEDAYWYTGTAATHDIAYGYTSAGPCVSHDAAFESRWREESIATGGNDFVHPTTRIHLLLGNRDPTPAPAHALDWADRLAAEATPMLTVEWVAMGHGIGGSGPGLAALRAALLAAA